MKKTTQEDSKLHNSRLVLKTIYEQGETSRVEVSRLTRLTRTTVSDVVAHYIQEGLVSESGVSPSRGGKPARLLRIVDDARLMLGIDLAEGEFRGALVNLRGHIRLFHSLPVAEKDGEAAVELVYALVDKLLEKADRPVQGIALGTPGLIDPLRGVVLRAVNLDWSELPLVEMLSQRYPIPIYMANDSQLAALAEFTFNRPADSQNLALVRVGRGVGAGIVLGGKLYYGDHFGAGEIGHVRMVEGGERCRCGNNGCLETLIGSRAIVEQARRIAERHPDSILNQLGSSPELNLEWVLQAYQLGDPWIEQLVEQAGACLGLALAHLVGGLNILHIYIAGSVSRFGERFILAARKEMTSRLMPAVADHTRIGASNLGSDVVILGAASLILSEEIGVV